MGNMFMMANKPVNGFDGPYYKCLCGVHVRTGSMVIALLCLVIGFIELWVNFVMGAISIILAVLLIYGHLQLRSWAYWPYLVGSGASIALNFILGIAGFFMGPKKVADMFDIYPQSMEESYAFFYIFLLSMLISVDVSLWMWYIVYRAYLYVKDVLTIPPFDEEVFV